MAFGPSNYVGAAPRALISRKAVSPCAYFRNSRLIPLCRQTEPESSLCSNDIDQNQRSDLELIDRSDGLSTGKNAVTLLSAFNRRILIDAQHCPDRNRLADNSYVSCLEHNDQCKRTTAAALGLPKRHCDRAIGSFGTAFRDPFVRPEHLLGCRREGKKLDAKTEDEDYRTAKMAYLHSRCPADAAKTPAIWRGSQTLLSPASPPGLMVDRDLAWRPSWVLSETTAVTNINRI